MCRVEGSREWAARLGLTLGGFVLAGLLVECALRWLLTDRFVYRNPHFVVESVLPADRDAEMAEPLFGAGLRFVDEPWRYGLKRELRARLVSSEFDVRVDTDDSGLRGGVPQSREGRRILGLGDSFAMGFGVEENDTYLARLARSWPSGIGSQPINAGVVGYNPGNSLAFLTHAGLDLEPDLVILQLWVVDDLCGGMEAGRPRPEQTLSTSRRLRELARYSHLAMLIRDRLRAVAPLRKWLLEKGMLAPSPALGVLQSDFRESCGQSMDRLRRLLQAADGACRLAGARFVVLLLPAREQVYPEDLQRAIEYNGSRADPAAIDSDAPNQALREALADSGVELVDVLDWLRSHREPERLFFPRYDPHLTPAGHLAVAEALSSKLTGRQPQSNPE